MDPTTTLEELRMLALEGDHTLGERFRDLDEWLSKGGFLPEQWNTRKSGRPVRTEDGPTVIDGVAHGTRRGYNQGCKCVPCTAANRHRRNLTPTEIQELTNG